MEGTGWNCDRVTPNLHSHILRAGVDASGGAEGEGAVQVKGTRGDSEFDAGGEGREEWGRKGFVCCQSGSGVDTPYGV
jgi:hypothetical protein